MDDHHDQPIWPMIQGAANYAFNLIEEAWGMIWKPIYESRQRTAGETSALPHQTQGEMKEVAASGIATNLTNSVPTTAEHQNAG